VKDRIGTGAQGDDDGAAGPPPAADA
jgi:hypothetical protein